MAEAAEVPVVAVVGPTASGKSDLALDLAERLEGEIVNTDAMALYRGMDVGTAKTPPDRRRGVPHHLLDVLAVTEEASVAVFQARARDLVAGLRDRGVTPVLVGGSALYTRAVLDDLEFPGTDPELRAALEAELAAGGLPALRGRLAAVDPAAAEAIEPGNGRRIVRALEVVTLTGRPFRARLPPPVYALGAAVQVGVRIDRAALDARIEARVDRMYADGLVEEVARLRDEGLGRSRTASRAIGYREVLSHLAGETTLAEAVEQTKTATRRFARRQESWWARDDRIHWVAHDDPDRVESALARVAAS